MCTKVALVLKMYFLSYIDKYVVSSVYTGEGKLQNKHLKVPGYCSMSYVSNNLTKIVIRKLDVVV